MESCAVFENNMHSAKRTKSWSRDRLVHLDRSLDVALSATKCRVGESDFGSSTNGRAPVYPRLARDRHPYTAQHGKDGRRRAHLNRGHDLKAMSLVERCI